MESLYRLTARAAYGQAARWIAAFVCHADWDRGDNPLIVRMTGLLAQQYGRPNSAREPPLRACATCRCCSRDVAVSIVLDHWAAIDALAARLQRNDRPFTPVDLAEFLTSRFRRPPSQPLRRTGIASKRRQ